MTTVSFLLDPDDLILSQLLDDDEDLDFSTISSIEHQKSTCSDLDEGITEISSRKVSTKTMMTNSAIIKPDAPASLVLDDDNTSTVSCSSSCAWQDDDRKVAAVVVTPNHHATTNNSKPTYAAKNGSGLSELSKQLRVLQAKNQQLQSQLERSERQLKILSDSKGVSVHELLKSLESACAKEAHAEWQNKVRILEAQLEALQHSHSGNTAGDGAAKMVHEKHAQQVAALELQLGEVEEVEQSLKQERDQLYKGLEQEKAATRTAEAAREEQQRQLVQEQDAKACLEEQVATLTEERDDLKARQAKMNREYWTEELYKQQQALLPMTTTSDTTSSNGHTHHKPTMCMTPTRLAHKRTSSPVDNAPWNSDCHNKHKSDVYHKQTERTVELELLCLQQQNELKALKEQAQAVEQQQLQKQEEHTTQQALQQQVATLELNVKLAQDQAQSLRTQLSNRDAEHNLKKDQLQSRIQLHQDRIDDLEQQLSSLYVAFDLLQQERSEEEQERHSLKTKLFQADEQMARTIEKHQSPMRPEASTTRNVAATPVTPAPVQTKNDGTTTTPDTAMSTPTTNHNDAHLSANTIYKGYLHIQRDSSIKHKAMRLLVGKDAWKKKYFVLKQGQSPRERGSLCLWYGEAPRAKVKGMVPHIIRGISTVGPLTTKPQNSQQPYHEFGFVLYLNPKDANAPVVALAADSARERDEWMAVLRMTLGVKYQELSWEEQQLADAQVIKAKMQKYSQEQ